MSDVKAVMKNFINQFSLTNKYADSVRGVESSPEKRPC